VRIIEGDHHMSNASVQSDPLERACLFVGRFLYHFGRVEQKIDQAVIKLLDLDEKAAPVVALVDFARKPELVRDCAYAQTSHAMDKKEFAKITCNKVHQINEHRKIIAHLSFEPAPGGCVQFRRTVTKDGRVRPVDPPWTDTDFAKYYAEMSALEAELDKLIQLIKPVPFGRSAPWLEMYHRSNSAIALAAIAGTTEVPGPPDQTR